MGVHRLFKAESPRVEDAEKDAWSAKIEGMTEAEFFSTPAHVVAPDRPLMRKLVAEYVSSQEMLEIIWRKSKWKPDPEFSYGGLAYAYEHTLEIEGFPEFMVTVLSRGFLPAFVRIGEDEFRQVKPKAFAGVEPFEALLNGNVVNCEFYEVRKNTGKNTMFSDIAPINIAEHVVWFKRDDVNNLRCDDNAVRDVMRRPESDDPLADKDPELVAHIAKRRAHALAVMGAEPTLTGSPAVDDKPSPIIADTNPANGPVPTPPPQDMGGRPVVYIGLRETICRLFAQKPNGFRYAGQNEMVHEIECAYGPDLKSLKARCTLKKNGKDRASPEIPSRQTFIDYAKKDAAYSRVKSPRSR